MYMGSTNTCPMARVVYWSMQENSVGVAYYGRGRNEFTPSKFERSQLAGARCHRAPWTRGSPSGRCTMKTTKVQAAQCAGL